MEEKELEALTHPALPAFFDHPVMKTMVNKLGVIIQDPKVGAAVQKIAQTPNIRDFYIYLGCAFLAVILLRLMITMNIKSPLKRIFIGLLTVPLFPVASYGIARWFFGAPVDVLAGQLKNLF